MTWPGALKATFRSASRVQRTRLEPLLAVRAAAGVAIVIGLALLLWGPAVAASSAFGAYAAGIATFQRSWRSRPELALAAGAALSVSAFLGYLAAAHWAAYLPLLAVWGFLAGMAWVLGPTAGILASLTMSVMLVVVTLPSSVAGALGHSAVIAFGGLVQAGLIVAFPVRRWGRQRDALADAFAAEADYARRLRHDPVASFDPEPLMTARSAATVTPARPAAARRGWPASGCWPSGSARCWPRWPTPRSAPPRRAPSGTGPGSCSARPPPCWTRWPTRCAGAFRSGSPSRPGRSSSTSLPGGADRRRPAGRGTPDRAARPGRGLRGRSARP